MLRWMLKKSARGTVAAASWMAGLAPTPAAAGGAPVRVLTYHRFGHLRRDPFCISPSVFEEQMAFLGRHGLAVSLTDLASYVAGTHKLRPGSVLVTIDDGHISTCSIALPILKRHAIPAVAFVSPSLVGAKAAATLPEGYATWRELGELPRHGVQVASHSMSHRSLGSMSSADVLYEAARSKAVLEDRLGSEVTAFAYPYGTLRDFNAYTRDTLRAAGYRLAFTSQHGAVTRGTDALELPRIKIESGEAMWLFRLAARGGLDQWKWIDRGLWKLQSSPGARSVERNQQC